MLVYPSCPPLGSLVDSERVVLRKELASIIADNNRLEGIDLQRRADLAAKDAENSGLRSENGWLRSENGWLRSENGRLRSENGRLRSENGRLLSLVAAQRKALEAPGSRSRTWSGARRTTTTPTSRRRTGR